jgi:imidazolonepropionase-like amidohydrolase
MKTSQGTTLITNGRLIDGTGKAPVPDAALVIQDGRIAYAGPAAGAPALPPDAEKIDARGGTILPGLVEAHGRACENNPRSFRPDRGASGCR